jgi:putative NADPH-quinone reductase
MTSNTLQDRSFMRALIIYDHPWEGSYVHAMCEAVQRGLLAAGHEIDLVDLHADGFDPVMRRADLAEYANGISADPKVVDYQQRMAAAQHLFFIFPVWWDVMPAMTKGFLDKVFLKHFAFEKLPEGGVKGL